MNALLAIPAPDALAEHLFGAESGGVRRRRLVHAGLFIMVSLLFHALLVIQPYPGVKAPFVPRPSKKPLSVQLRDTSSTRHPAPVTIQPDTTPSTAPRDTPPRPLPRAARQVHRDSRQPLAREPRGLTAEKLMDRSLKAVPDVTATLEKEASPPRIVNPALRAAVRQARRDRQRRQERGRLPAQGPGAEVTARTEGYTDLRIGSACWRLPEEDPLGPQHPRLAKRNFNCPSQ